MRLAIFSSLVLSLSSIQFASALSEEESTVGVDLGLLSDVSAITPGKPFTVALKVHHHKDFHTYWQAPGIVGVPFSIEWKLPEGFIAGPIQWPYPQKVDMAGHPAHGYERDILLLVEITPPATLASPTATLTATASWMACAAGCHPETKSFTLNLPSTDTPKADVANSLVIEKARTEIPRPLTEWTATLESSAGEAEIRVKFTRSGEQAADPGVVYFFSSDGQISSTPPQKIEPIEGGFRLIAPRAEYGPERATSLPGVLVGERPLGKDQPAFASVNPAYPAATTVIAPTP